MQRRGTFDSPSDEEESLLVVFAQVTRVQPALFIQSIFRLVGHVKVPHEDVATPEADFTISLLVWVVQLCFAPWDLFTTAAKGKRCNSAPPQIGLLF